MTSFWQACRFLYSKEERGGKEAFERLRLGAGDFLEVEVTEEGLLLIPKDQAWFWTKEWQAKGKEVHVETSKLALHHGLGDLPMPQTTHRLL